MSNYEQAVAREEENRLLAYLNIGRPIFGRLVANLTWRHVLELSLAQNAFFAGREPAAGDVYEFLWHIDQRRRRPDGSYPNIPAGSSRPSRFASWRANLDCRRISLSVCPNVIEAEIRQWISEKWQDMPSGDPDVETKTSSLSPRLNWFDTVVGYYAPLHHAAVLDLPVAATFQRIRHDFILRGDGARCTPPSAALKRFSV